jgi:superfamily II DNA/RNA helicase
LAAFAEGRARALVATDVAARGIHVDDLPCVVHYDPPADHTDYLHRSGRTGRAGKTGIVVSLVDSEQVAANRVLQRSLGFATVIHPRGTARNLGDQAPTVGLGTNPASRPKVRNGPEPTDGRAPGKKRSRANPVTDANSRVPRPRGPENRDSRHRPKATPFGTVKFFDAKRGYGFLSRPGGAGDIFVHASSIQGLGPSVLRPGQQVRFEMTTGRKGDEARNVTLV